MEIISRILITILLTMGYVSSCDAINSGSSDAEIYHYYAHQTTNPGDELSKKDVIKYLFNKKAKKAYIAQQRAKMAENERKNSMTWEEVNRPQRKTYSAPSAAKNAPEAPAPVKSIAPAPAKSKAQGNKPVAPTQHKNEH